MVTTGCELQKTMVLIMRHNKQTSCGTATTKYFRHKTVENKIKI